MPSVPERLPITRQLEQSGVVAILRASSDRHLEGVARTLGEAGVTCLELTLTTPGAVDALARVRSELPGDVALGMGSVIDSHQAAACLEAGADFLVSPGVCAEVAVYAAEQGVACYPGGWTPTELLEAWRLGAPAVKLFPAASGGPRHLKDVRAPLPHIPLVPTGGVALEQIADYVAAGAVAVGLGGPLVGDALDGGSLSALARRAATALEAVQTGRGRR
ncbi:MAG: bifunctional 4-hydroxy-2-oxoglutarate aldolase/2-dehydro-3-deoxy-phosphogluconate aldolase [Solirubrobacteraceae bacterium]